MSVLASNGRLTMEKRKQEALGKVKRQPVDAANHEKLKVLPNISQSLRAAIARKVSLQCGLSCIVTPFPPLHYRTRPLLATSEK